MSGAVLLTGGTGFLGMELIARLLAHDEGPDILVAVRARDDNEAGERIGALLSRLYDTPPASAGRLRAVRADLTSDGLGLSAADRAVVTGSVERIVHCAASISFTLPLDEARSINVDGTLAVLDLARQVQGLERLVHVSTAYVSGRTPRCFLETDLDGRDFRNTYEQTKLEAELAVADAEDLPVAVVRPSIVVGESDSGWTSAFNVIYWPLQAFARGLFAEIPADPDGIVDLVPVDYVAEVIERAAFAPDADGTFNAVAAEQALTVAEMTEMICRELGATPPRLTPPGTLPEDHPGAAFAPYFDIPTTFDERRARSLMAGATAPNPASYLPVLLQYAQRARWGKRHMSRQAARALVEIPA